MVVLLWSVGTSAPPLPSGRRARPTSIGPPRAAALRGWSALWKPPAVPALWHRGPPEPWPIGVDGSAAGAPEAMAGCRGRRSERSADHRRRSWPGDIPRGRVRLAAAGGIRRRRGQQSRPPTRETSPAGRKCPQPRRRPPPGHNRIGAAAQVLGDGRPTAAPDDVERLSPRCSSRISAAVRAAGLSPPEPATAAAPPAAPAPSPPASTSPAPSTTRAKSSAFFSLRAMTFSSMVSAETSR